VGLIKVFIGTRRGICLTSYGINITPSPFIPLPLKGKGEDIERGAAPLLDAPFYIR